MPLILILVGEEYYLSRHCALFDFGPLISVMYTIWTFNWFSFFVPQEQDTHGVLLIWRDLPEKLCMHPLNKHSNRSVVGCRFSVIVDINILRKSREGSVNELPEDYIEKLPCLLVVS